MLLKPFQASWYFSCRVLMQLYNTVIIAMASCFYSADYYCTAKLHFINRATYCKVPRGALPTQEQLEHPGTGNSVAAPQGANYTVSLATNTSTRDPTALRASMYFLSRKSGSLLLHNLSTHCQPQRNLSHTYPRTPELQYCVIASVAQYSSGGGC